MTQDYLAAETQCVSWPSQFELPCDVRQFAWMSQKEATEETLAETFNSWSKFVNYAIGSALLAEDKSCAIDALEFLCSLVAPRCVHLDAANTTHQVQVQHSASSVGVGRPGAVFAAQPICLDYCEEFWGRCPQMRDATQEFLLGDFGVEISCAQMPFFTAGKLTLAMSQGAALVDASNHTFDVPCFDGRVEQFSDLTVPCAYGQVRTEEDKCATQCPLILTSDDQVRKADRVMQVGGWVSVVCSLLMIATWSLQRRKRTFPARFILYFSISLLLCSVAAVLSSLVGEHDMRCHNNYTPQRGSTSAACFAQASLWLFGSLSMTAWWLAFVVTLYWTLVKERLSRELRSKEWVFHSLVWQLPCICVVLMWSNGLVRFNPEGMLCFVSNESGPGWQLGLFWVPQLLMLAVGLVVMIRVVWKLMQNARRIGDYHAVAMISRFLLFIPLFLAMQVVYLVFGMRKLDIRSQLDEMLPAYYECVLYQQYQVDDEDRNLEQCHPDTLGNLSTFTLDIMVRVLLSLMGVWVFLVFGLRKNNLKFWKGVLQRSTHGSSQTLSMRDSGGSRQHTRTHVHKSPSTQHLSLSMLTLQDSEGSLGFTAAVTPAVATPQAGEHTETGPTDAESTELP